MAHRQLASADDRSRENISPGRRPMSTTRSIRRTVFHFTLIKPSHYDDDGYVIQWLRSAVPANSLAVLYGLANDCRSRDVLGADVALEVSAYDETNTRIRIDRLAARIRRDGGRGLVGLVGVQSNQFPRAMDIARQFRAMGIPVCIGGFHVSGCLAMLPDLTPELKEALACGISLFAGEAEDGRLEQLLQDAYRGTLCPIYQATGELPSIEGAAIPILPARMVRKTASGYTSFDSGRGCPFQCSFCTIINVQGRKSRYRSADDVEQIVRANVAQDIRHFFVTDDNFARNKNWEKIFDRLIDLREIDGLDIKFVLQVDTLCHKIPNFIEKAALAGVTRVFIGLESINPETLANAKKRQNRITEYRRMVQAWRDVGTLTYAGYILGFPTDTPETVMRDIEIVQRELPVDLLEFFCLTPLPGSEDHANLFKRGTWMDPDLNKYDAAHVTTHHPRMSREEWERLYRMSWKTYYSPAHIETILRRARVNGIERESVLRYMILWFYGSSLIEGIHPLEGGFFRLKFRRDRRPGLPIESRFRFYRKYLGEIARKHWVLVKIWWGYRRISQAINADPAAGSYTDLSLTPVSDDELDQLDMFTTTEAGKAAVTRARAKAPSTSGTSDRPVSPSVIQSTSLALPSPAGSEG